MLSDSYSGIGSYRFPVAVYPAMVPITSSSIVKRFSFPLTWFDPPQVRLGAVATDTARKPAIL